MHVKVAFTIDVKLKRIILAIPPQGSRGGPSKPFS